MLGRLNGEFAFLHVQHDVVAGEPHGPQRLPRLATVIGAEQRDAYGAAVGGDTGGERRFTAAELAALLADTGFTVAQTHAVRVFADLVPSTLLDLEPGAVAGLLDLERAVAARPEYLSLAGAIHTISTV